MYETSRYRSTKNSSWTIYKLSIYKSSWSIYKLSIYEIENPICYTLSSIEKIWILKTLFLIYHGALIIEENWQKHVHHKLSKTVDFCVCVCVFFLQNLSKIGLIICISTSFCLGYFNSLVYTMKSPAHIRAYPTCLLNILCWFVFA